MVRRNDCSARKDEVSVKAIFEVLAGVIIGGILGLIYWDYFALLLAAGILLGFLIGLLDYYIVSKVCR